MVFLFLINFVISSLHYLCWVLLLYFSPVHSRTRDSHLRCLPLLTQLSWSPFAVRHKSASSSLAHLRSLYHITFLHSIFFRNFTHIFSFLWIKLHKLISACHFYPPIHFQNIFRNLWFLHIPNILLSHFFDIVIRVKAKDLS